MQCQLTGVRVLVVQPLANVRLKRGDGPALACDDHRSSICYVQ